MEFDHYGLDILRKKAVRLVFGPAAMKFENVRAEFDIGSLGSFAANWMNAESKNADEIEWHDGFLSFSERLMREAPISREKIIEIFSENKDPALAGDPRFCQRAFLEFLGFQFVCQSVEFRIALCVAENDGYYSLVDPLLFEHVREGPRLELPAEGERMTPSEHAALSCEILGADQLWFALATDVERAARASTEWFISQDRKPSTSRRSGGFEDLDRPWVEKALQKIRDRRAKSNHDAACQIADEMRQYASENNTQVKGWPGASPEAIVKRLSKRIAKVQRSDP